MIAGAIAALRPSERMTTLVLAGLLLLIVLVRPDGGIPRAATFAGLLLAVLLVGRVKGKAAAVLRDFLPILVVLLVFLLLQPLVVAVNVHRWDAALAAADARWFGRLAEAWHGAFGRPAAFTDLIYLAYASFYFLPITVAALAWRRLGPEGFERVAFRILLGFYLSFLGYFLWPAEGPRVPEALAAAKLGGGAVSQAVRAFLHRAESTTLDAFPSGHTALSVLPALLATRPFPRLAPLLCVWALGVVFATVYIGVHYVVDVAAGLLLAGITLALAAPLSRWMGAATGLFTDSE
ncbi:MAG TPA: phosphatase PAP2 family protein [Geothrix sp.]|uniref:phosphatase PAP2 family protein n=1 Tax=Geothrix mesophila TaxID=2922723 RepID=UPI001FADF8D5|nr:phosphatase PAP2 family protein [Geothrix sp. SG198]HJV38392.1 phosphatase PAP2 family protein [Geothrix sp.]